MSLDTILKRDHNIPLYVSIFAALVVAVGTITRSGTSVGAVQPAPAVTTQVNSSGVTTTDSPDGDEVPGDADGFEISTALAQSGFPSVQLSAFGTTVTLHGQVADEITRQSILDFVSRQPNVDRVVDAMVLENAEPAPTELAGCSDPFGSASWPTTTVGPVIECPENPFGTPTRQLSSKSGRWIAVLDSIDIRNASAVDSAINELETLLGSVELYDSRMHAGLRDPYWVVFAGPFSTRDQASAFCVSRPELEPCYPRER